jgi:hypothetical protein
VCRVATAAGSAFTKSSVIRDCVEDTDVNETVRLRIRGLVDGGPPGYVSCKARSTGGILQSR